MKRSRLQNLIPSRSGILVLTFLSFFGIMLIAMACSKDGDDSSNKKYPSLKIVNADREGNYISSINLVGYDFNNLNIPKGNSQTFTLENGMPGGYENINVTVSLRNAITPIGSISKKVNFKNGVTTTITLRVCRSYDGCNGYILE